MSQDKSVKTNNLTKKPATNGKYSNVEIKQTHQIQNVEVRPQLNVETKQAHVENRQLNQQKNVEIKQTIQQTNVEIKQQQQKVITKTSPQSVDSRDPRLLKQPKQHPPLPQQSSQKVSPTTASKKLPSTKTVSPTYAANKSPPTTVASKINSSKPPNKTSPSSTGTNMSKKPSKRSSPVPLDSENIKKPKMSINNEVKNILKPKIPSKLSTKEKKNRQLKAMRQHKHKYFINLSKNSHRLN